MNVRRRANGFTLIEILVVVAIVAIITAAAVLSLGIIGDDQDAKTETRRLASLLEVAQDEAMMQGREFGLEFLAGGYRFVEYDPLALQWTDIPGDETLRPRELPEGLTIDLFLEEKRILLGEELAELGADDDDDIGIDAESDYAPHILIYSSGDMTPFEIHVARRQMENPVVLTGDVVGALELTSGEQQ